MINKRTGGPQHYLIVVQGILDIHWQEWFDGLTITPQSNGCTLLEGRIRDQAELHGILKRINNLGLKLISINLQKPSDAQT